MIRQSCLGGPEANGESRQRKSKNRTQASYRDVSRALNRAIKDLVREHDSAVSELAAHLLALDLEEVESGRSNELAQRSYRV